MKRQSKTNNSVYNTYSTTTDFDLQSLIDEYTDTYTKAQVDALTAASSTNCKITIGDIAGTTSTASAIKPGELFVDSTSGNAYVGTANGSVSNLGNLTWATTATGSAGWGYAFDKRSEYFDCFIEYLTEAELSEMISKFISRGVDNKDIKGIVRHVMDKRHCSEDFIMEFIDYADLSKLKQKYSAEIKCQEYPRLALLCQSE